MKRLILLILLCVAAVAQASTIPDAGTYVWTKTPRWFGAKGDSTTNDRAAFVSAIARLDTVVGGAMELPPGRYALGTDSIRIKFRRPDVTGSRPCFTLEGHGPSSQIWVRNNNGGIELYADTAGNGHGNALIKDIDFYADTSAGHHPAYAIYVHNIGQVRFENCHFYGFKAAIKFKGAQECNVNGGEALGNDTAAVIDSSGSPAVYANQINFRDFRVTGRAKTTSIGYWIRGAQDGTISGEQVTNCLYGKKQTDGQKYQCSGVHFEQNRWGVADFGGGDYLYIGCTFYANNVDYYNIAATAPFFFGCLFNDTLITGASSQRTGIWLCRGASGTKYMDSVVFASNENNWGWNVNSGSGNLPTGIRGVFPGTASDTTDFAIFAPGTIDMEYGVIAGGTTGSIWTRMQPQGADTVHGWNNGKAGWFILDGTNDTVAALYATTNTAQGWVFETYAGAATGDSLIPRLYIYGDQVTTNVTVPGDLNSVNSVAANPYRGVQTEDSGLTTKHYVDLTANNQVDSVSEYQSPHEPLALPYSRFVEGAGNDSLLIFSSKGAFVLHVDSNLEISAGGPYLTLGGFYAAPEVILGVDSARFTDTSWFVVNLHDGVPDTIWLVRDSIMGGGGGQTDTMGNAIAGSYTLVSDSLGTRKTIKGLKAGTNITITSNADTSLTITATGGGLTMPQIRDSLNSSTGMNDEDIINVERIDPDTIGAGTSVVMHIWPDSVIFDKPPFYVNKTADSQLATLGYVLAHAAGGWPWSDSSSYGPDSVLYAHKADSAGKATNDGAGAAITSTYLPRAAFDDSVVAWLYWNGPTWRYSSTDGDADPTASQFRTGDNGTGNNPYTADTLYIDSLDIFGNRCDTLISTMEKGWLLRGKEYKTRTKRVLYRVEAKSVDASGYWKVLVHAVDTGTVAFVDKDTIIFEAIPDPRFLLDDSGAAYLPLHGTADSSKKMDTTAANFTTYVANHAGAGGGDDTGAFLDANGGTALERPYIDMYGSVGVTDTLAFLTDSTVALLWTDSTLAVRGKQKTVLADTTGDNTFRVVTNSVEMLDINDDSIDFNGKKAVNIDSADIVKYTDGSVGEADIAQGTLDSTEAQDGGLAESDMNLTQFIWFTGWMGDYGGTDSEWVSLPFCKQDTVWSVQDSSMHIANDKRLSVCGTMTVPPGVNTLDSIHVIYQTSSTDSAVSNLDSLVVYNQAITTNTLTRVGVYAFGDQSNTALTVIGSTTDIANVEFNESVSLKLWGHVDANGWFRANVYLRFKY